MVTEHAALCRSNIRRDDGVGGADPSRGSGLIGLADRVEALGGTLRILSPVGGGTGLHAEFPA
jgi:signal transduction histidine kinase